MSYQQHAWWPCQYLGQAAKGFGFLELMCVWCAGTFLRGALEKAGVDPNIIRIGKYKSAGESGAASEDFVQVKDICTLLAACDARVPFLIMSAGAVRMHTLSGGMCHEDVGFSCLRLCR